MNFYIADLHFGHENVIGLDNRLFSDVNEMDRTLIELWNGRALNAGCMINGYMPVTFKELVRNNVLFEKDNTNKLLY